MKYYFNLILLFLFIISCSKQHINIDKIKQKAKNNDPVAQFQLAILYDQGTHVKQDLEKAANLYLKSANSGYAASQNSIGSMYQYGEGIQKNYKEAVYWYKKAVEQDYTESYTNLGFMYDFGLGVDKDQEKAFDLYLIAAQKGSIRGMLNAGISYWKAQGTEKNLKQAHYWLNLARYNTQKSRDMKLKWRIREALDGVKEEMDN